MPFDLGSWNDDAGVQALDYFDRGVWFEILLMMWESPERGRLLLNGHPMTDDQLQRRLHLTPDVFQKTISTLINYGVASRVEDGCLINRKMVRDAARYRVKAEAGRKGGQTALGKEPSQKALDLSYRAGAPLTHLLEQTTGADNCLSTREEAGDCSSKPSSKPQILLEQMGTENGTFAQATDGNTLVSSKSSISTSQILGKERGVGGENHDVETGAGGGKQLPTDGTWISPLFQPDKDQWRRLELLGMEFWGDLGEQELMDKLRSILREFVDYWLEIKRLDQQKRTKVGVKQSWYLTFRRRVSDVGAREARRAITIKRNSEKGGTTDGTRQFTPGAAERNRANLAGQDDYLRSLELQAEGGADPEGDAPALELDPSDFG